MPAPTWGKDLRDRYPDLASVLSDRWLESQTNLPGHRRSWFFTWVEPDGAGDSAAFLDDLAACVADLRGANGVKDRVSRLVGPVPEFWAALCELKLAALLARARIRVTLHDDTPDIRAHVPDGPVGVELTAGFPTLRYTDVYLALAHAWLQDGRLILLAPDETDPFLTTERDALVERIRSLRYEDLPEPVISEDDRLADGSYIYRGAEFSYDERRVPTDDIVDPTRLEVYLALAPVPVVISRSGARSGYSDPWPDIVNAAAAKARKLPPSELAIVAFEGGHLHPSARLWAGLVAEGHVNLDLALPSHVAGVLCYWQDARRTMPVRRLFVWNDAFTGARGPVKEVLDAFGIETSAGLPA